MELSYGLAQPWILPVDGKQPINLKVPVPKSVQTLEDWGASEYSTGLRAVVGGSPAWQSVLIT